MFLVDPSFTLGRCSVLGTHSDRTTDYMLSVADVISLGDELGIGVSLACLTGDKANEVAKRVFSAAMTAAQPRPTATPLLLRVLNTPLVTQTAMK